MYSEMNASLPDSTQEYFDHKSENFYAKYMTHPAFQERCAVWKRYIRHYAADVPRHARCLDIGCGPGVLTDLVAQHGLHVTGIDQSANMLTLARSYAQQKGVHQHTEFIQQSVPLPQEFVAHYRHSLHLIVCSSVLEYVPAWQQTLEQFHSMLRPGGILLISVPNRLSLYRGLERLLQRTPLARWSYIRHQYHQFDPRQIPDVFADLGFTVQDTSFFALPFQKWNPFADSNLRPSWLATMLMVVAQKGGLA